jgi:hypothetical protein
VQRVFDVQEEEFAAPWMFQLHLCALAASSAAGFSALFLFLFLSIKIRRELGTSTFLYGDGAFQMTVEDMHGIHGKQVRTVGTSR